MTSKSSVNLKLYLLNTALPEMRLGSGAPKMPPASHKSHTNSLTIRFEPSRKLHAIYQLRGDIYEESVPAWIERHIPEKPMTIKDRSTGERLTVPDCQNIPPISLRSCSTTSEISTLLEQLPLATAQRALHHAHPETAAFRFMRSLEPDIDEQIFQHFEWKHAKQANSTRLVLVVQPPWVLSPQDMKSFSNSQTIPLNNSPRNSTLVSKHRLWGKVWDLCASKDCRWFVVTTFHGWVFGSFSDGWTTAYVSPIVEWNDVQITSALQSLVHWTASAMGLSGGWRTPSLYEGVRDLTQRPSVPAPYRHRMTHPSSESSWDGKYDTPPSSAGLSGVSDDENTQSYRALSHLQSASIRRWADTAPLHSPCSPCPPSPTGSTGSNWSQITSRHGRHNVDSAYQGDWMALPIARRTAAH